MKKTIEEFKKIASDPVKKSNIIWTWIGSFFGILTVSYVHLEILEGTDLSLIIGSFGASAVLIYGAVHSPLSQPRNLIGGHFLSALIGVTIYKLLPEHMLLSAALAVSLSIFVMQHTLTLHPPGGATALIAIIGDSSIHELGYLYVFIPVLSGSFILLIIALLVNNIPSNRHYPYRCEKL
ncbi:MAG: HPP family protein [uncultured Sulfurovum sp.]|uniref:HPP family protein n=1 Tax=uncultured Sulfurovum sp. TaxID=269237 RepID=A0A6S6TUZ2_9BACT|nr:MAG: HPP family protein [uncultured Sulfurovum sp.]